jgi:hypothetical protein
MKHQLLALYLTAFTTFGVTQLAQATPASFQESGDLNDNAARIQFPLNSGTANTPFTVSGSVRNNDKGDVFSFTHGAGFSRVNLTFSPGIGGELAMFVVEDNGNGVIDTGDRGLYKGLPTTNSSTHSFVTQPNKTYLVKIGQFGNPTGNSYRVILDPQPADPDRRVVQVTVVNAQAMSDFGDGAADFFTKVRINNGTRKESRKFDGQNSPTFNFVVEQSIPFDQQSVDLELSLIDSDVGNDDVADISPDFASRLLRLRYVPSTGEVFGFDGRRLGSKNSSITQQGDSNSNRASITFKVTDRPSTGCPTGVDCDRV